MNAANIYQQQSVGSTNYQMTSCFKMTSYYHCDIKLT